METTVTVIASLVVGAVLERIFNITSIVVKKK